MGLKLILREDSRESLFVAEYKGCGVDRTLKYHSLRLPSGSPYENCAGSDGVQYILKTIIQTHFQRIQQQSVGKPASGCLPISCSCECGLWHLPEIQLAQCSTGLDCMRQCSFSSCPWHHSWGLSICFDQAKRTQFQGCLFLLCREWFIWHTLAYCSTLELKGRNPL